MQKNELKLEIQYEPDPSQQRVIRDGIIDFNQSVINDKPICFNVYIRMGMGMGMGDTIIAGAIIYQHKDAFYIDVIWVNGDFRQQGRSRFFAAKPRMAKIEQDIC